MTLARVEPLPTAVPRWHRHRGVWREGRKNGVWMTGAAHNSPEAKLVRGRITVRVRRCGCGRIDVVETWPGGKRRTVR